MFDFANLSNPQFIKENRLNAHCDAEFFDPSETSMIKGHLTGSRLWNDKLCYDTQFRHYLNGTWKFAYAVNFDSLVKGFETPEFNCSSWEDIYVPAHIQMEGYGAPHYTNTAYPWDAHNDITHPEIPADYNPVGAYVKYFTLPARFTDKPLYISFQGVESSVIVYLNGHYVGYSEDSFTPADFDLTPYITEGENKLALIVNKWCSGSWLEDQDFFRFSGIFRDVFIYTKPSVHAEDLFIKSYLNSSFSSANVNVELTSSASGNVIVEIESVPVSGLYTTVVSAPIKAGINNFAFSVDAPFLWSSEQPNLYGLKCTLCDTDGNPVEVVPVRIGFRRFEMKNGLMLINGKRIVFKGVNRHEFSSITGRAISYNETRHDLVNMKLNNINAIRTCHYPDNSFVYALADELGFYVIDETNMETHGTWSPGSMTDEQKAAVVPYDHPCWKDAVLDRVNSIFQRDKNHACVLIWSCGNESYGGLNIYEMSSLFKKLDDTRLVHYEGICHDRRYNDTSDMESQMYTHADRIKQFLDEHPDKPFICCEYSHAMGNSCGGMHKYTDLTDTEPRYQGGFIWDYIDQSITSKDRFGNEFEGYGGDFGDRPTDYNFSGNGIAYGGPDRLSSPKMPEVKYNYQNITVRFIKDEDSVCRSFEVTNKHLFTNTAAFDCMIELFENGQRVAYVKHYITDVAPLSKGIYEIPEKLTSYFESRDGKVYAENFIPDCHDSLEKEYTYIVTFMLKENTIYASIGHEIAFGQYFFKAASGNITSYEVPVRPYKVIRGRENLGVIGLDYTLQFTQFGLTSYNKAGREMIQYFPGPAFWRAPIDNDRGSREPVRYAQWKLADMYRYISNYEVAEDAGRLKVIYTYTIPTTPAASCTLSYTVEPDGTIITELAYDKNSDLIEMPLFGMNFCFNADYDQIRWYGYGPEETYVDRSHGNKLHIHKAKASEQLSKYLVPQECANKIGVRYAAVTDRKGRGVEFKSLPDVPGTGRYVDEVMSKELSGTFEFQALPYSSHELENAYHAFELPAANHTYVRIALAQLGVGGDDSWGSATHDEYRVDTSKPLRLRFSLKMI